MELPWSVRCGFGANTVTGQGTRSVDAQTRSEDFYTATSADILLATREDFFMATDIRAT
jgi:hypothetical protein